MCPGSHIDQVAHPTSTLQVVAFPLGSWVGGLFTTLCLRFLTLKGYRLTTVTPGGAAGAAAQPSFSRIPGGSVRLSGSPMTVYSDLLPGDAVPPACTRLTCSCCSLPTCRLAVPR